MKQFLVVDDSRVVRKVARRILEELQFGIEEAEDGVVALETCRRHMPDAILLDWNMPNMNGIEFLQNLRASGNMTTFGFVTSESNPSMKEQAIVAGAAFLLTKPFDAERLAEVVGAVVG